jgi:hypothetical protein
MQRPFRRETVENTLPLGIEQVYKCFEAGVIQVNWTYDDGEPIGFANLSVTFEDSEGTRKWIAVLRYEDVEQRIPLIPSRLHHGGITYYLSCPNCGKRVEKLYRPLEETYFWCRKCHNLTYRSSQERYKLVRLNRFYNLIREKLGDKLRV